jgi:hypothetical protein
LRCSWDKRSMIMAALHIVNHDKLSPDAVSAFAADQIRVGIRCGDFNFRTCRYETAAKP